MKIFPLGENALTVEFGGEISTALNDRVLRLEALLARRGFAGFIDAVPAYSTLTIFYDVCAVRKNFPESPTAFAAVRDLVEKILPDANEIKTATPRLIEIPVCFDAEVALDLEFVAAEKNLAPRAVIKIFLARTYRVFMLGFLPGFAYLGEIDERIAVPRRQTPRLKIPTGSVGLAGRQTGIYPFASPGGWQIIGRTPLKLFTPEGANPTLLRAGDAVKFYEITKKDFTTADTEIQRKI